ncbi:MAG: radical SAM protein [bacterium]
MKKTRLAIVIPPVVMHTFRDPGMKHSLPHIGIAYLASNVDTQRTEVIILDCPVEHIKIEKLIANLEQFSPDVVGFTASTFQINEAAIAADAVKKSMPTVTTLIGGYHVTPSPVETMERYPSFDIAVVGEGEQTLKQLLEYLPDSKCLSSIDGICYRNGGEIKMNPPRALNQNLDNLAFPAFHLMPMEKYKGMYILMLRKNRGITVSTARGCPYQCTFCYRITGSNYRTRSIPSVAEEIKRNISDFKIDQIVIIDESFTINRQRTYEFCEQLLNAGIPKKIGWVCASRVDLVDQEILKRMKEAGCELIVYGIESGNQDILNKIKKNARLETAIEAIRLTKQAGIKTFASFIFGLPYETKQTIQDTINFAMKIDPDLVSFSKLTPFPGTAVAEMAKKGVGGLKLLTNDYTRYGRTIGVALELEQLPLKELDKYHRLAYLRFYMRPSKFYGFFLIADIMLVLLMIWHTLASIFKRK